MSAIIISCALTGSVHTPSMSPYLPVTPEETGTQGVAAALSGAAILHVHARDPVSGKPSADPGLYEQATAPMREHCDAVINITTGGSALMSLEERLAGALHLRPEMCSLNLGSMNFGLFGAADRRKTWQHDWELPFLEGSRDMIFKNTFQDIECVLQQLGEGHGSQFEFECYDVGHLYTLAHFVERGMVKPPFFIQFVFGILGGIGADIDNLVHMRRIADKLFGDQYLFSVLAAGRHQIPMATAAATMGGHVRVGLEDNLYLERGRLACSNAELVSKIRGIVESLGRTVASPDEVRTMLSLKGREQAGPLPS